MPVCTSFVPPHLAFVLLAFVSLVVGLLLAPFVARLTASVAVQLALSVVASAFLLIPAPDHGSSYATGLVLSAALAPVTALVVVLGRIWRSRATVASVGVVA